MSTETHVGTELLGYHIESLLGRGGMSSVYLAEHRHLRRKVALKILAPALSENEAFRQRFLRESQLAASLDHPNIVPIYDAGEFGDLLFIAMRFVDGTDLAHVLRAEGPLDPYRTVALLAQVAGALDTAHAHGLVHRDVKPGNILVETAGWPEGHEHCYLTDFGLTKQLAAPSGLTDPGGFAGTVDFVAPEQIEGKPLDGRTDVYSLACVMYQCLAGQPPFERANELAVIYAHLQESPPRLRKLRPELPAAVEDVIEAGLAKDMEDRPATSARLIDDLRVALGMPSEVDGSAPLVRPERTSGVRPGGPAGAGRLRRWRWPIAAVLVAAVAVVSVAVVLTRNPGTPASAGIPGGHIFVLKSDGTGLRQLTSGSAADLSPVWSPDGTAIAFTSTRNAGLKQIFLMDADGRNVRALPGGLRPERTSPAWSPDGTQLAFVQDDSGNRNIYVVDLGTGRKVQLTDDIAADEGPVWSPDGTKIAFSSNRTGNDEIYVMNSTDGSNVIQLTTATRDDENPAWSPDGTRIAFDSQRDGNVEVYVMNADGLNQTRLTNDPNARDANPAWSPDGSQIAYARGKVGATDLYVMSADGTRRHAITTTREDADQNPNWLGDLIVFVRNPAGT